MTSSCFALLVIVSIGILLTEGKSFVSVYISWSDTLTIWRSYPLLEDMGHLGAKSTHCLDPLYGYSCKCTRNWCELVFYIQGFSVCVYISYGPSPPISSNIPDTHVSSDKLSCYTLLKCSFWDTVYFVIVLALETRQWKLVPIWYPVVWLAKHSYCYSYTGQDCWRQARPLGAYRDR